MSRLIDRLPEPEKILEKKVIILSRSRVGTFSLYQAMKMLGYKPYHFYETVTLGVTHLELFKEAVDCKYKGTGKPYGKKEFDKWLAAYDCVIEIPQFFIEEFIKFYPDAKFILTERDIEAWTISVNKTAMMAFKTLRKFPFTALRHIDGFIAAFCDMHYSLEDIMLHGRRAGDPVGMRFAQEDTKKQAEQAKSLVPKDQLLVCRLEDGFGWEEICPFLDQEIPEQRYPKGNAPEEFDRIFRSVTAPAFKKAGALVVTIILVPAIAGAFYWYKQ